MNILIVRLGALGDVIHAVPAAAALRRAFPAARHRLARGREAPRHRRSRDRRRSRRAARESRRWRDGRRPSARCGGPRYDIAIDLQGLMKSAVLARASGAARVVGFSIWHLREKTARPFYSDAHDAEGGHVIRKNLRLLRAVGVEDDEIRFPLADVPSAALDELRRRIPPDRPFALINAGAAWPNKRWPAERFGELASFLRDACGVTPVVLWGPGEEGLADAVIAASSNAADRRAPRRAWPISSRWRARRRWSSPAIPVRSTSRPPSARRPSACSGRPIRSGTARLRGGRGGVALRRVRLPLRSPLPRAALVSWRGRGRRKCAPPSSAVFSSRERLVGDVTRRLGEAAGSPRHGACATAGRRWATRSAPSRCGSPRRRRGRSRSARGLAPSARRCGSGRRVTWRRAGK